MGSISRNCYCDRQRGCSGVSGAHPQDCHLSIFARLGLLSAEMTGSPEMEHKLLMIACGGRGAGRSSIREDV